MLKYVNIIVLVSLAIFAGCNNPSGGSSIARNHTPLLQPPGTFSFTQIRAKNDTVSLRWTNSPRVSTYSVFQGTDPSNITTPLTTCSATQNYCNLTGLNPATLYYYSVVATNAAGTKRVSSPETSLAVGDFDITSNAPSNGAIDLTWTNSTGATSYNIIYGTRSGSYTNTVTGVTSPYTLSGLTNNRTYYVRVVAVNANNGYGLSDTEISDTPYGPPPTPASVLASATPSQITLTWASSVGAQSYNIYKGTTSGSLALLVSGHTTTTYTDFAVTDGTEYFYTVQAVTGIYSSSQSAETSAKPISNFAMTSVAAGPGTSQITVTWPTTTGADSYDIRYGTNPANLTQIALNATSPHVISGLTGNVTYYFRVRANNTAGDGTTLLSTNQLNAIPIPLLAAPTGFTATATPGQIVLNWNAVSGASNYEILRGTATGVLTSLASGINATTYTDTPVTNGTAYFYVVRGFNGMNGTSSAEISAKPIASFTISSITSPTPNSLQVTWGAAAGADAYDILYRRSTGATTTLSNVTSPATISGLLATTTYYVTVRARNAQGSGTTRLTAESSFTTKPGPPSSLALVATPGKINATWSSVSGADSYTLYRGTASGGPYTAVASGLTVLTYDDTTITDGTQYYYVVTATNSGSESDESTEKTAQTIDTFSITSATPLTASTIQVTWPVATGATSYNIRRRIGTGAYTTINNVTSPYTLTGLAANTTYGISIVASNSVGSGTTLASAEETAKTATATPAGLAVAKSDGQASLTWTPTTGAATYKVFRGLVSGTLTEIANGLTSAAYIDTVSNGTVYYYAVVANNGIDSAQSTEVAAKTIEDFTVTSANALTTTTIQVTWPAVAGADAYDVLYRTTGATTTLSNKTSPFTITGLASGTTYHISVKARNSIGTGASNTSAELDAVTPVGAPSGLVATVTPGSVELDWTDIPAATSYKVSRGTASGTYDQEWTGVPSNTYTDSTVANGTTYYYAVRSFNGSDSSYSSEIVVKPIAAFTVSSTTATATTITVNWTNPAGADAFDVQYRTGAAAYTTISNVTSPATITGRTANTAYDVRVVARNSVGAGTSYTTASVSQTTALTGITDLAASHTSALQIGLNWGAKTGVTNYRIYRRTPPTAFDYNTPLATVTGTGYLDTAVTADTNYSYVVRAYNGNESVDSNEVAREAIDTFTFSTLAAASSTSLDLTWTAATGADDYKIVYGVTSGSSTFSVDNIVGTSYTLTSLTPNQIYYVKVVAQNASGSTVTSSELNATTAPAAPTGLAAVASTTTSGRIALTWTATSGASSYNIYRSTTSNTYGAALATGVTGTSYTDTTITEGTQYYYKITAYSTAESPKSSEVTGKAISNFSIGSLTAPSTSSVQVTWTAPAGSATFDVLYRSSGATTTLSNQTSPVTISGLNSGTTYYVIVRAKNAIGSGTQVDTAELSTVTPVGAPNGFVATVTPGSVELDWNDVPAATSYKVSRGNSSGSYDQEWTGITTETYTDTSPANGSTYYYAVRSYNGSDSSYSSEIVVKPIASFTVSSTTATATTITVNWTNPAGGDAYDVQYRTGAAAFTTVSNVTSPATITGLTAGTAYDVKVVARNAVGLGTSYTTASVSQTTALSGITDLTASHTSALQVGLNWGAKTGVTNYRVYRRVPPAAFDYNTALGTTTGTGYLDTTVSANTTYAYVVRAYNGNESVDSNEVTRKAIGSFTFSTLTAASSTSLDLTWTAASGADNYKIVYGTTSGSSTFSVDNVTGTSYTLTSLSTNQIYYVRMIAQNSSGSTVTSSELNATTAPAAPTGLVATTTTTTAGQIKLDWVAASGASSYNIYRSTTSNTYGAALATGVTGTTYTDTTISEGTQYYYKITAYSTAESPMSSEVTGKAISNFSIDTIAGVDTSSIQVAWTAPNGSATFDVLYRSSGATTTLSNKTSPFTITGLTAGTTYYVIVRAKNAIGSGTQVDTAELNANTAVSPPTALTASADPGQITLGWTAASGATNYKIYRSTTSNTYGAALVTGVTGTSYLDTDTIANGTTYYYVMRSYNGTDSAQSSEVSVRPIASFTIGATTTSASSMNITWSAVAGASSYDVYYGTSSGTYGAPITGATSPQAITGLANGTTYFIKVVAKNAVGAGTTEDSPEISAATAFGAPGGLAAVGKPTQIELSWSNVNGADSYKVYRRLSGGGAYTEIANSLTSPAYNDATAANGTAYDYVVTAIGDGGATESAYSTAVSVQSISAFTISSASPTAATTGTVSWGAATGATSYDVYIGTSSGTYGAPVNTASTSYNFTGLTANTLYYVRITAKNAIGNGTTVNSNESSFRTSPAAIADLNITSTTSGGASLTWSNPGGTNTYTIKRGTVSGTWGTTVVSGHGSTSYTDSGLTDGQTYYYIVTANNGTESANSNEDSIQPISTFSISSTTALSSSSIKVDWGTATGAATYEVWMGTSTGSYGGSAAATVAAGTTTATITGLTSGTTYYIQVRAKNTVGGVTTTRNTSETTQITPLGAPTISSVVATPGQAVVTWGAVSGSTSYRLYWGTSPGDTSGGFFDITHPTVTKTHTGLTNGQAYYYTVRSYNGAYSDYSTEQSVKPIASFTVGSTSATATTITVNWTTPVDGADSFDVEYRTGTDPYTTLSNKTSGFSITGLTDNTAYDIRLVGRNTQGAGTSLTTASVSKTTAVGAPTISLASTDGTVSISWGAVSGATGYKVFRNTSSGGYNYSSPIATPSASPQSDSPAVGSRYYYVVRSDNGSDSVDSNELSIQPIDAVTISSATAASSSTVNLSWNSAAGATSYDVYYRLTSGSYGAVYSNVAGTSTTVSGLTANTSYTFKIVAKNAVGVGATRTSNESAATTSPAGITDLAVTSSASGGASLTWSNPGGATSYTIKRGTVSGTWGTTVVSGHGSTSYTDSGLTDGTTYYYVVIANNGTDSAVSNEDSIQPIANFSISSTSALSDTSIRVNWGAAAGAANYEVWIGTSTGSYGGSAYATVASGTLTKDITGLTSGTTYYIQVRATNTVGGPTTTRNTAETTQITPLGPPTISSIVSTPTQAVITWGSVNGATSYRLFWGTSPGDTSGGFFDITHPTVTKTHTGLTNGQAYYYTVQTYNGAYSASSTEKSTQPIATFTVGSTSATDSTITVNWSTPVAGADTFDIEYRTGTDAYTTLSNKTSGFQITGLTSNTAYDVRLIGKNTQGFGTSLTTASVSQKTALGAPSGLTIASTDGTVSASWTGNGATTYKLFRATSTGGYNYSSPIYNSSATSTSDSPTTDGTTYYYVVRANNGSDSVDSTEYSVKPIAAVTIASATPTSASTVDLSWNAAAGAASYDVYYRPTSGSYGAVYVNTTSTTATVSGLTANTSYTFKVIAKNAVGVGATRTSNEPAATTAAGAPSSVALDSNDASAQVSVSWAHNGTVTSYKIYRGTSAGSLALVGTVAYPGTSFLDTSANGVANGTLYYYSVRSYNGIESADSTIVTIKPMSAPTLTAATAASDTSVNLTWTAATGADTYDVYYGPTIGANTFNVQDIGNSGATSYTLTGLTANTLYYIKIRARNTNGTTTTYYSNTRSFTTATAAPTSVVAAVTGASSIRLTWTDAAGASNNNNVWRSTTSGSGYTQVGTAVSSGWTDTSATDGTTFYYVVRAFNGTESANSSEVYAQAIASFSITSVVPQSSSSLRVTWPSPAGGSTYDVLYRIGTGSYTTLSNKTSPFDITGLAANTAYKVLVRAKNSVGVNTSMDTAETTATTATAAPSSLTATGGTGQVALSWTAPASPSGTYTVYRGTTSGSLSSHITSIGSTSYTDNTSVTNGTTYYYAVLMNNGTASALSNEVASKPIATPVISSVTGDSSTSVLVSWGAAAGADTYNVQWGTVSGTYTTTITGITATSYQITGLTAGTTYYVRVQGVNAVGSGTTVNSAQSSGTPNSPPVLSSITTQTVEADNALPVNFTLSDSNNVLTCTGNMSASSSNTTLLPNANIVFSGTLPNCVATLTPATNQTGTTTITLTANDGVSSTQTTFDFTVTPCTVASIVWDTQPTGMAAGSLFGTAPRVKLLKADGVSLCMSNTAAVQLVVSTDTTEQQDASITGTASVTPSGGYALFNAASMQRAGTGFTVAAVQNGVTSLNSNTFNVTAGSASKFIYYQQPLTNDPNTAMIPAPSVRTADTYGNYVAVSGINVTMSLQDNTEGATLGGTLSATTNASGIASFTNLSINTLGNYYLRATPGNGWAVVNSDYFDIIIITPQNFTTVAEMISGPIWGTNGNATWDRTNTTIGTNYMDGLSTCTWKIVAYNDSNSNATISLRNGSTSVLDLTVSRTIGTTPTVVSNTFVCNNFFTATGNWNFTTFKGATILSSQIILKQVSAKRTQTYIPLISIAETDTDGGITTTSTTPTVIADQNHPTYDWDSSEWTNLNEVVLAVGGKTSSGSFCGALFNKTTGTQIGGEICSTSTADAVVTQSIPRNLMPSTGELEVRVRNTSGGTATIYKAGIWLRLVNIVKAKSIQRAASAKTLTATDNFVGTRFRSALSDFGSATKNERLICRAKSTSGTVTGSITMKNATNNTSGTTNSGTVTGSTINYSNTASYSIIENTVGPTTNTNYYFLNYTHTTGSLDLSQCLYSVDASY